MRKVDLTGEKFGRLTVISQSIIRGNRNQIKWDCICECGTKKTIPSTSLRSGSSKSCGCLVLEGTLQKTHGMSKSRIYRIYRHMINRCGNHGVDSYPLYGGRGIRVCEEWKTFEPFYEWAMQHGYADNLSIDRRDNEKGYYPDNCRWSTELEQARNKRNTVASEEIAEKIRSMRRDGVRNRDIAAMYSMSRSNVSDITYGKIWKDDTSNLIDKKIVDKLTYNGETKTAAEWQRDMRTNVTYGTILRRKRSGMSDYDALFSEKQTHNGNAKLKQLQSTKG